MRELLLRGLPLELEDVRVLLDALPGLCVVHLAGAQKLPPHAVAALFCRPGAHMLCGALEAAAPTAGLHAPDFSTLPCLHHATLAVPWAEACLSPLLRALLQQAVAAVGARSRAAHWRPAWRAASSSALARCQTRSRPPPAPARACA